MEYEFGGSKQAIDGGTRLVVIIRSNVVWREGVKKPGRLNKNVNHRILSAVGQSGVKRRINIFYRNIPAELKFYKSVHICYAIRNDERATCSIKCDFGNSRQNESRKTEETVWACYGENKGEMET